jgi:hypothetical protein
MDTDQFIRILAADEGHAKPVWFVLTIALSAAAPISIAIFALVLGVRPDIMVAVRNPLFDLKFVVTLSLAIPAIAMSVHYSRPEVSVRGWAWLLVLPACLLLVGIADEVMFPPNLPVLTRLVGRNWPICLSAIPALALPLLAATMMALRHGASSKPALTGGLAGLLSSSLAATLYASNCTDDSPLFVMTWYSLAGAPVTAVGALAGRALLRF